jgi:hypothetical protein
MVMAPLIDTVYYLPQAEVDAFLMLKAGSITHAILLRGLQALRLLSMQLWRVQRSKAAYPLSI